MEGELRISRRDFLKLLGISVAGFIVGGCSDGSGVSETGSGESDKIPPMSTDYMRKVNEGEEDCPRRWPFPQVEMPDRCKGKTEPPDPWPTEE